MHIYKFVPLTTYKWLLKPFSNVAFKLKYILFIIITYIKPDNFKNIPQMQFSTDYRKP